METKEEIALQQLYLVRLRERDRINQNYSQLFPIAILIDNDDYPTPNAQDTSIRNLRMELRSKEQENQKLKDIIQLRNKDYGKLNDEIIGLNLENSLLQEKLASLQNEYDILIERWLAKAQLEADAMNNVLK
ncbi:Atg16p Ecym_5622 [Eremothecium cymbalariae DBVPG|uniref:Autophagy-related protein 16 domain-containing protein n=1 Tax=Eremothecium cymbalariae (strain CBS 270.75 / DBVPG 7215 / KCTC 17166 / NRRL Y-17582) TaxID=931890 RepID=I6NE66_ERECY|nr:hypothetical protein Ecym_5622 [Eremothecium cymbalariae DBVPG\